MSSISVALSHDYLTQLGGGEHVLAVLSRHFPHAPIVTSLAAPRVVEQLLPGATVHESFLGWVPGMRARHRLATPVYPLAFRSLRRHLQEAEIVIADTSAWAHLVPLRRSQRLLIYVHSPARFLYGDEDYLAAARLSGARATLFRAVTAPYRRYDRRGVRRANRILANSANVAERVKRTYGREARVVYPPVDTAAFRPADNVLPTDELLVVSRLVPHKRVDLAIAAANALRAPLAIIGEGRDRERLEAMAGPTVRFLGRRPDAGVREALQRCRALLLPGAEDFGMTAVEAQAAGRPVVAYAKGGALESVAPGETGVLFPDPTAASLIAAIEELERQPFNPATAMEQARRFDTSVFLDAIDEEVAALMAPPRNG